jgi:AAA domain/TrwC relaxase
MLNVEVNRSAEGVERYFDRELALSDYLMKEPGTWAGRGAERLGLRGPVQRSQFVALLRNENPTTGKRLTARTNTSRREDGETVSNRQVGYGLVFGVPKSLSIQGFQLRPERVDLLVIDEASMLSVPQMLWLLEHARKSDSRALLVGDSAQHRSVERGDALRILEQSGTVRYVELLQTQRQKVPALKAAIEDLKAGRLQAGWEKLEHYGVIKEVTDGVELRKRAVEQHLEALRAAKRRL